MRARLRKFAHHAPSPNLLCPLPKWDQGHCYGFRAVASTILNESNPVNRDWIERQLAHVERNEVRRAFNAAEWMPLGRKELEIVEIAHHDLSIRKRPTLGPVQRD